MFRQLDLKRVKALDTYYVHNGEVCCSSSCYIVEQDCVSTSYVDAHGVRNVIEL